MEKDILRNFFKDHKFSYMIGIFFMLLSSYASYIIGKQTAFDSAAVKLPPRGC